MQGYMMSLRKKVGKIPLIQVGSAIIFVNEEKEILMIKNKITLKWGLPGGSMEPGESLEDCARREAIEEIGLKSGEIELLNVFSGSHMHYIYHNGDEVYNVAAIYTCRDYSGVITPDHIETDVAKYFNPLKIPENVTGFVKTIIDKYIKKYYKQESG